MYFRYSKELRYLLEKGNIYSDECHFYKPFYCSFCGVRFHRITIGERRANFAIHICNGIPSKLQLLALSVINIFFYNYTYQLFFWEVFLTVADDFYFDKNIQ